MHASNLACLIDTINSSFHSDDFSKEDFKSPDTINSKSSQLLYEEEEVLYLYSAHLIIKKNPFLTYESLGK